MKQLRFIGWTVLIFAIITVIVGMVIGYIYLIYWAIFSHSNLGTGISLITSLLIGFGIPLSMAVAENMME